MIHKVSWCVTDTADSSRHCAELPEASTAERTVNDDEDTSYVISKRQPQQYQQQQQQQQQNRFQNNKEMSVELINPRRHAMLRRQRSEMEDVICQESKITTQSHRR